MNASIERSTSDLLREMREPAPTAGEVAMPEPQLFDGVRLSEDGKYGATEDGYTADQLRAYGDARASQALAKSQADTAEIAELKEAYALLFKENAKLRQGQAVAMTQYQIADIVRDHMTSVYVCTRVWEAWSVGTMTEDDFVPASETDMADDIAAALVGHGILPAPTEGGAA